MDANKEMASMLMEAYKRGGIEILQDLRKSIEEIKDEFILSAGEKGYLLVMSIIDNAIKIQIEVSKEVSGG